MSHYTVTASAKIPAPADHVYAILADYETGHRAILPERYFTDMIVTNGGVGAGTEIVVHMSVFGQTTIFNLTVTEPEPGRVLQEADEEVGLTTTFTLDPSSDGATTTVTIHTIAKTSSGLKGMIEKWMNPPITRQIYNEELQNLAKPAQKTLAQ
jgi:uncharacterized protein YndB with AHSA1/START domain